MIDRDKPPTFPSGLKRRGSDAYPMGGVKTGPAWRGMWEALCDARGEWVPGVALDEIGAERGRCSDWTAKLLLHRAAGAGVIEKDKTVVGGRWQVRYRVSVPEVRDDA